MAQERTGIVVGTNSGRVRQSLSLAVSLFPEVCTGINSLLPSRVVGS